MKRLDPAPEVRAMVADRLDFVLGRSTPRRPEGRLAQGSEVDGEVAAVDESHEIGVGPPSGHPFGRAHVAVVTVLVVVGLLGAGWSLFRARPVAVAAPEGSVSVTTAAPGGGPPAASSASPSRAPIVVHVVGAVRRPGLVRLVEGARVQDAIDAAEGLTDAARPGRLNLAQPLADGQQVVVGTARDPVSEVRDGTAPAAPSGRPGATAATLDLNHATAAELEQLPGVGPVTAAAILAWRTQHGRFGAVTELQQVDGIGPKTYAQIAPHVRV